MKLESPSNLNPNTPSVAVTLSNSVLFGFTVNILLPSVLTKSACTIFSFESTTVSKAELAPVIFPAASKLIEVFLSPVGVVVV